MKRTVIVGLAVVGLLGAFGCSDDDSGDDGTSSDGPDTAVTAPPGDTTEPPPGDGLLVVTPTPGLDGVVPAAIDSVELVADDKLQVTFYNGVPECYGVDRVEVEETDTEVTVSVFTGSIPQDGDAIACIEIAQLQAVTVTLDAPLGERTVVDGSTGTEIAPT